MKGARIAPREGNGGPSPWIAGASRRSEPTLVVDKLAKSHLPHTRDSGTLPNELVHKRRDSQDLGGAPAITGQRPSADRSPALTARKARGAPYAEAWSTAA